MIAANELRIGNWVHLKDKGFYQIDCGHDIDEISTHEGTKYCVPIALTEYILLKCEAKELFTNSKGRLAFRIKSLFQIDLKPDGEIINVVIGYPTALYNVTDTVKHLHQLQNLYFALTETELDIQL